MGGWGWEESYPPLKEERGSNLTPEEPWERQRRRKANEGDPEASGGAEGRDASKQSENLALTKGAKKERSEAAGGEGRKASRHPARILFSSLFVETEFLFGAAHQTPTHNNDQ